MRPVHDVATVRTAEQVLLDAMPDGALMERAATGLATECGRLLAARRGGVYGARVVLLVGSGNNGGDAMVAGAWLARRGARVDAVLLSERPYPAGVALLRAAGGRTTGDAEQVLAEADLVVDGIVGIGGQGALRPGAAALVDAVPPTAVLVAVDVPSGVDSDTGVVEGAAVRADVTVTFGTLKPGLVVDPGGGQTGELRLVDIGLGPHLGEPVAGLVDAADLVGGWPWPGREGDKYARGAVGILAGSTGYSGAAVLCTSGALRAGAGYVRVAAPADVAEVVRRSHPEAVVTAVSADDPTVSVGQVQAWAVGPGMGVDDAARTRLAAVLGSGLPVVLDADALTHVARDPGLLAGRDPDRTLLTPHAGELARLLGVDRADVEARRLEHVREATHRLGVTVLLKGRTTLVAAPSGPVAICAEGPPELATAGSGDVLTGVCGMLLAAGRTAAVAGALAAWVHGAAARTAAHGGPLLAHDVAEALPATLATLVRA